MSAIFHGLAHYFAGQFFLDLSIIFFIALISYNHDWHVNSFSAWTSVLRAKEMVETKEAKDSLLEWEWK